MAMFEVVGMAARVRRVATRVAVAARQLTG